MTSYLKLKDVPAQVLKEAILQYCYFDTIADVKDALHNAMANYLSNVNTPPELASLEAIQTDVALMDMLYQVFNATSKELLE